MQTKKPHQTVQQTNKKVITVTGKRGRSPSQDKTTIRTNIREKLKKLLLESVFEIPDASCKPLQAYISAYSTSRAQGLITLLCTTSGYNIITNVAFVARRHQSENYEIEKTWIKNAIRLYINIELEPKELKIVFADELK